MKRILGRPGYANVTATLALVVALGGTSYAAVNIPKNSVGSPQIKKEGVRSSDVKDDGLKGKDINESSLAQVPSAATANDAHTLGGLTLRGVSQWALVGSNGAVVQHSSGVTSTRLREGRYRVTFPTDVLECGFNANAASSTPANDATNFAYRMVMVARSSASNNIVHVETARDDGMTVDNPFFITAQC